MTEPRIEHAPAGRLREIVAPILVPVCLALFALALFQVRVKKEMPDFAVYWTAGTRVVHAQPLYRPTDGHYQFKYLPAFAIAMAPFARFDEPSAAAAWYAFTFAWLLLFLRWSIRLLPDRRRGAPLLVALSLVFMAKFYGHELVLGQVNSLFGILLIMALGAIEIDLAAAAGAFVAAAVFVKPYGIIFAPWLLLAAGRRALGWFALVAAAGLLVPALLYGWTGNIHLLAEWFRTVTSTTTPNLLDSDNVSLAAMWAKWIGIGRPAATLASIAGAAALGSAGWIWSRRSTTEQPAYLELAHLFVLVPLLSPQGWDYVLLLATPAVALLLDRWKDVTPVWRTTTALALAVMGLTFFDLMGRPLYARFMATSAVTVGAMALIAALVNLRHKALA